MSPVASSCCVPPALDGLLRRCVELGATLDAHDNPRLAVALACSGASPRSLGDLIDDIGPLAADCHRALTWALMPGPC